MIEIPLDSLKQSSQSQESWINATSRESQLGLFLSLLTNRSGLGGTASVEEEVGKRARRCRPPRPPTPTNEEKHGL